MSTGIEKKLIAAFNEGVATTYLKAYEAIAGKSYDHTLQSTFLKAVNAMLGRMKKFKRTAYADTSKMVPTLEHPYSQQMCMACAVLITLNELKAGDVLKKLPTLEETLAGTHK